MIQVRQMITRIAAVATVSFAAPSMATAQTTVYSTFGPGDSYDSTGSFGSYPIYPPDFQDFGQQVAAGFLFGGPSGELLSMVRFAREFRFGPINVTFLVGPTIGSASPLESWTLPTGPNPSTAPPQIYSFTSINRPLFISGDTYWLMLSPASSSGGANWMINSQGLLGLESEAPGAPSWFDCPTQCRTPAFDVSATSVTPEPATLTLMSVGLAGIVGAGLRRRKKA